MGISISPRLPARRATTDGSWRCCTKNACDKSTDLGTIPNGDSSAVSLLRLVRRWPTVSRTTGPRPAPASALPSSKLALPSELS